MTVFAEDKTLYKFELLKTLQEQEVAVNINGNYVIKNPGDLHMHFTCWVDKYSKLPKTTDLLLKCGTDGWPRVLLRAARTGGVFSSSNAQEPPEAGMKKSDSNSPPPNQAKSGDSEQSYPPSPR